jgi:ribosomal protein S18 acetylase RimI-like enzyme
VIRLRQPSDLPELVRVLQAVYEADGYPDVWPTDPLAFVENADPLAAWVAEADGQVVGQVLVCSLEPDNAWSAGSSSDLVEIKRLFVSPSAQGLGLAQQLMQTALAEAARRSCRAVLETRADNEAANRFYQRGGWQRAGTVRAIWTDADGQHPQMQLYTAPPTP